MNGGGVTNRDMKLLVAVDMEGISGVVHWDQVAPGKEEYRRFQHIMTADVNAAIAGALQAGAEEVLVTDGHGSGRNLLLEELHPSARLNSGLSSPLAMVEGVDGDVDAVLFIGYHARAGTQAAILDHTWSSRKVMNIWMNDRVVGEIGLNAAVCGQFDVPILMISGDQSACVEAVDWIPGIETVIVKQATGRLSASCISLQETHTLIHEGSVRAVKNFLQGKSPMPLKETQPIKIVIEFINSQMADNASLVQSAVRLDGRKVSLEAGTMLQAYRSARALIQLA
jgi:D-amino peptidase